MASALSKSGDIDKTAVLANGTRTPMLPSICHAKILRVLVLVLLTTVA